MKGSSGSSESPLATTGVERHDEGIEVSAAAASAEEPPKKNEGNIEEATTEADGADRRLVRRLAAAMRSSALAAMPYEAVEVARGTEAYCRQHSAMVEEFRRALVQLPPELGNELLANAESTVEEIMSAAKSEMLEIGLSLQPRWHTLTAAERRPWDEQHRGLMEEYERSRQLWREGTATEPQRPSGAYFAWIRDAMREEWERRRRPSAAI